MGKIVGRRYRFVDDYKKEVYVGANGRSKERIRYIGEWVWSLNEKSAYKKIVLLSRIAVAVIVAAVVAALMIVPLPLENKWYLPVMAVALFPLMYAVMGVVRMPNEGKPMERQRFANSFERARVAAIGCLVIFAAAMLAWIVYWILFACGVIKAAPFSVRDGVFAVCLLLAGTACMLIVRKTKEIKTELRDNASYKPE